VFDAHGVAFVSVTQAFNTATSMGRLTLNVLLSFAQFEREVTAERIRDKIAASKKKGMWMGGYPPLGYDVKVRKLVVNEAEAETVRYIVRRYQELRSVRLLKEHLDAKGIVSKRRTAPDGGPYGGKPIARGHSISCCRTASIAVRSCIRTRRIQASTIPSSMTTSGRRCRRP
jgi:site-specific DNA recombinase